MEKVPVLLIGDFSLPEFAPVAEWLCAQTDVVLAPDTSAAMERLAGSGPPPQAIVLAYPWPGAISVDDLDRLRQAAPLVRQLAVLGTWCEGESRSGRPLPGVIRTYWHQWLPRWVDELGADGFTRANTTTLPGLALPETAADEERLLYLAARPWPVRQGLIAIATRSYEMADLLGMACQQRGYATVWLASPDERHRIRRADAVLWDVGAGQAGASMPFRPDVGKETAVVALLDFPRKEEVVRLTEAGVDAVVAKPLLLEDLFWHLDRLAARGDFRRRIA